MKIVQIPNYGPVSFPDTFSEDEINQKAQQLASLAEAKYGYKPDYREQGLGALAKAGFGRAAAGLGTTLGDVIPAMAASALGFKDYAQRQMEEAAQSQQEIEEKYPTAFKSYKDVRGIGDVLGYVAETIGELGPDMLAMLTGAGAGSVLGRRLAVKGAEQFAAKSAEGELARAAIAKYTPEIGAQGGMRGAGAALFGTSFGLNAPDTFQGIYDKTGNLEPGIAVAFGAAQALLDSVTPARLIQQFTPAAKARVANELIQQSTVIPPSIKAGVARQLIKTGAIEAGTEGSQELLGILAERTAGAQGDIFSPENLDRMLNASIKGLIGGTTFGAPGAVSEAITAKRAAEQELARRAAQFGQMEPPPPEAGPAAPPQVPPQPPVPPTPPTPAAPPAPVAPPTPPAPSSGGIAQIIPEAAAPVAAPAAPPARAPKGIETLMPSRPVPTSMQGWGPSELYSTLEFQLSKPEVARNRALVEFIRARLQELGLPPERQTNVPVPPAAVPATAGAPPVPPTGESVSVPVRPAGGAAPAGVTAPEPSGVVRGAEPAQPAVSGTGNILAPLTDPEAIDKDIQRIIQEKGKLVTKSGHAPSPRSPARAKFDLLDDALAQRKAEWQQATGTDWTVVWMERTQGKPQAAAPAAPPVAALPAPPVAPPVAPAASVEEQIKNLKARWSEAAARGDSDAARRLNDEIVALKSGVAPPVAPAPAPAAAAPKPAPAPAAPPAAPAPAPAPVPAPPSAPAAPLTGGEKTMQEVKARGFQHNRGKKVTDTDVQKIAALFGKQAVTPEIKAARDYFFKTPNAVDGLDMIGFDTAYQSSQFRTSEEGKIEAGFMQGMSGGNAKLADAWVRKNLSPAANKLVADFRKKYAKEAVSSEKAKDKIDADQARRKALNQDLAETEREEFKKTRLSEAIPEDIEPDETDMDIEDWMAMRDYYKLDAVSKLAIGLHPVVRHALYHGDIQQALRFLAQSDEPSVAKMARVLMQADISPKVNTINGLTDPSGKKVPGYYDPKTNTIYLDSVRGMNSHVLFHEIGHAAMSHVIADPNHPVTKQLNKLFTDVKDDLGTAYGARDLQEFVAEAWANDEFKARLNMINPMGGEITAWQRFVNIIQNVFRRLFGLESKPIESAFDQTDKLIKAILSPAPLSRDSELLYAATVHPKGSVAEAALEAVAKRATKLPGVSEAWVDNVDQGVRTFGAKAKELLFSMLPEPALTDVAKKYLPMATRFGALIGLKRGDEHKRNEKIEATVSEVEKWAKGHAQYVDALNKVIYDSTLAKVDPTKPRSAYENRYPKQDIYAAEQAALLKKYDQLHDQLKAIPGGKEVYSSIRDTYKKMYEEIKASIGARVDDAIENEGVRTTLKNEIYKKLAEHGDIDPYFPLTRNGDFWISYTIRDETGQVEDVVRAFETERERNRFRDAIKAEGATDILVFSKLKNLSYKNVPPTSFVHNVLKLMELNRPEDAANAANFDVAMEQILRMFLSTLPETSFAQAFHRREGIAGFNRDAIRALREKSYSMSRQLSNMKYAVPLNKLRQDMIEHLEKMAKGKLKDAEGNLIPPEDNKIAKQYFEEMDKRIAYAISPTTANVASRAMSSLGFNYLLGFNVSSAVVNLSQIPLIVVPYLGAQYGYGATGKAVHEAYRVFLDSGLKRTVEMMGADGKPVTRRAMWSLDNIDFSDPKLHPAVKKYATLSKVALDLGMLNRSQLHDALEMDGGKTTMDKVNAVSGFAFHHGERMNRQVSLMAAYNLELQRLNGPKATQAERRMSEKQKEEAAANRAIYLTELTNGGTGALAAPRIAQGSLGKVLFMFKSYGVMMNYVMFKAAREALSKDVPPEVRKVAFKQLTGILGTSALFAGLQGMPMFGVVAMLYNLFKDDDDEDFGTVVRTYSGETAYKGVINAVTGLSIAERIGLSNMIIRDDPFSAGAATMADTFAQIMGGPVYGVASRVQRGMQLFHDGYTARGIENILPVGLANVFKATRYATEGANTMRGDPIIGDLNAWSIGAQVFGFAPAEYTQQLEINSQLKGIEKAITQKNSKLMQRIFVANQVGDSDGMMDAYQQLQELYAKHPGLGNPKEAVDRSMEQQKRISKEKFHGLTLPKKLAPELQALAAEMGD